MNELDNYNGGEQIDSLLKQMEDMEQELTNKNMELKTLRNQLQEKNQKIQNLSSGSQKLKSQIQSMKSVLSEQGETLRHQTEQLEKYSGSDIVFQENGRLKEEVEKSEKRGKELEEKAAAVLAQAGKKEEIAGWKLAKANRLLAEYQETLAGEVEKAKRELRKKAQEESDRVLHRKSMQLSEIMMVLLAAYLAQMAAVLIIEKDTTATIPLWFLDRGRDVMRLFQNLGNLYQHFYQTLTTTMPPQMASVILVFAFVAITAVLFLLIRIVFYRLLRKWEKRWEYYECRGVEVFKKSVMIGIALMGFSLSLAVMKLPFIPIRLNVVSWWILITGIIEYLYFNYDEHDYF